MPSARTLGRGAGALAALSLVGTAAAQPAAGSELGLGVRVGLRFVASLVVAGLLVGLGPRYAARTVRELLDDPGGAFGWGLLVSVAAPIALVLLAFTVVGLVITVPGLLLLIPVSIVGNAVAVVAVGTALAGGSGDPGWRAVLAGSLALAVVGAVPLLGGLLTRLVGLFGVGVVGRDLYRSFAG